MLTPQIIYSLHLVFVLVIVHCNSIYYVLSTHLTGLLLRYREDAFVLQADIRKAFQRHDTHTGVINSKKTTFTIQTSTQIIYKLDILATKCRPEHQV